MHPESLTKTLEDIKLRYPDPRSALLPALHRAEKAFGMLSDEAIIEVSESLNVPPAIVKGVSSFHNMFRGEDTGRHLIQLCTNVSCMLFGAESLIDILRNKYGLEPGGATSDGRFSLVIMECIGACDSAPAMLVNDDLHTDLNAYRFVEILEKYK